MKKIRTLYILFIVICLTFNWGCKKDDAAKDNLREVKIDNIITVNFPEGSIESTNPTVEKIADAYLQNIFNETADLFNVANSLSYQVKISIGSQPPNNDEIEVILNVSDDFITQTPSTNGIELFALTYQNGGEEILDNFELISSTYNPTEKTLTSKLPRWVFTNERNGNYETVLTIASTPGNYNKSLLIIKDITEDCLASQITCPIGTCVVTSEYNQERFHPVKKIIRPHWGTDFRANGSPVYTVADGKIIRVKTQIDKLGNVTGFGLYIVIRHDITKASSLYAHLSSSLVTVGQKVKQGDQIGVSGNSGTSSGPHLHFEYVPSGEIVQSKFRINPFPCITPATLPSVTTTSATNITSNSAASGGNITSSGGATITARGVCWTTSPNPTIANSKTNDGTGVGNYTSNLTGLSAGTIYYVRAYATNNAGTAYGTEINFITLNAAVLTTTTASSITSTTALSGGNISSDGGSPVTARGVCWSISSNPTTANSKTNDGTGTGIFISNITGLSPNTTYYVRAYATNSSGTSYGTQISFTTLKALPTLAATTTASSITSSTANSGGNVTSDGGASITARGVCWSTSINPTTANNKTSDGTGTGVFTSSLTGLNPNTTYYVRAYASNSIGTAYGSQISFTTTSNVNLNLDGNWVNSSGLGITITGATGVFYSFSSGWQDAANRGFISIGSAKLSNISKTGNLTWSCRELWRCYNASTGATTNIGWGTNGTISMSPDGKSFTLGSYGIDCGSGIQYATTTYNRVGS